MITTKLRRSRRGMAALVVLLLVSAVLAVSYAAMRSQTTVGQIQRNAGLGVDARQAASTGLTMALKKMHAADWAGVGTTLHGSLGDGQGYDVTYTPGDPSLSAADSDFADFPYRVTLTSVGYAAAPGDANRRAVHTAQAVVRLVPRKLPAEPSDWNTMQQYVLYQTHADDFDVDLPCQIAGRINVIGTLKFAYHYPTDFDAWSCYLRDLNRIRQAGGPDYRPFTGPVRLYRWSQQTWTPDYPDVLRDDLGITPQYDSNWYPREVASDWRQPRNVFTYQIFDGGPRYDVRILPNSLHGVTIEPDPLTNPLGLCYRDGSIAIGGGVTIRGMLICEHDVTVTGTNVRFEPVELPEVHGASDPLRLPTVTCENFVIAPNAGGSLTGLLAVFDDFRADKGPDTTAFAVTGRLITRELSIKERQPWDALPWHDLYEAYKSYRQAMQPAQTYFPVWLADRGRDPRPRLTVAADPSPVAYHWYNQNNPIFVPHPDDTTTLGSNTPGLRWELIEWQDNP